MTSFVRKPVAFAMIACTVCFAAFSPALAANAVFTGRVLDSDGVTPRPGVVVTLVGDTPEHVYRSAPTRDEGAFRIETAPAGSYALIADTSQGAFLADGSLRLREGANNPLALTLNGSAKPNYQGGPGGSPGAGGLPTWAKWTIAGVIGVAAVLLVIEATDDNETMASDF